MVRRRFKIRKYHKRKYKKKFMRRTKIPFIQKPNYGPRTWSFIGEWKRLIPSQRGYGRRNLPLHKSIRRRRQC